MDQAQLPVECERGSADASSLRAVRSEAYGLDDCGHIDIRGNRLRVFNLESQRDSSLFAVGQLDIGERRRIPNRDRTGALKPNMLPDAHVAITRWWNPIPSQSGHFCYVSLKGRIASRFAVAWNAGDINGKNANRQSVGPSRVYQAGDIELKATKHACDILLVSNLLAVNPHVGPVVDAV